MDASILHPSGALSGTEAYYTIPGAMAHREPLNWSSEADTLLTTLYKNTSTFDIDNFKSLNASIATPVTKESYDLLFLQDRLEELLGPYASASVSGIKTEPGVAAPKHLHRTWLKLEVEDGRVIHLRCVKCNGTPPAIYKNVKTEQLRCGHCGNMDSSHFVRAGDPISSHVQLPDLKRAEAMEQPGNPRTVAQCVQKGREGKQDNNGYPAEANTAAGDLDTPSKRRPNDVPRNWNVVLDMNLKQWYRKDPKRFDIDGFKFSVHRMFHGAPNLCISPGSYDLIFLHDRLDRLIGPCICHLNEEDRASLGPDDEPSFFHREWRAYKLDRFGHRLYCDHCQVSPPIVCRNERSKDEYRCGACGNSNVIRMPCDEPYYEHLNSVIDELRCVLNKRMAAGLPDVPSETVKIAIRKRMSRFQQGRSDKPQSEHESTQPDKEEGVKIKTGPA